VLPGSSLALNQITLLARGNPSHGATILETERFHNPVLTLNVAAGNSALCDVAQQGGVDAAYFNCPSADSPFSKISDRFL
jgi:hypothetical protein